MNHREPPHLPAGTRLALHCLSLLLLTAMASDGVHALPRSRVSVRRADPGADPTPYLPVTGAPPLRFHAPPPPPDLVTHPPAAAPPTPALSPTEVSVAQANAAAARSAAVSDGKSGKPGNSDPADVIPAPAPARVPAPILPDTLTPAVRPEDFLPFFQIPGAAQSSADAAAVVPAPKAPPTPGTLPPSSATYTQTPK